MTTEKEGTQISSKSLLGNLIMPNVGTPKTLIFLEKYAKCNYKRAILYL